MILSSCWVRNDKYSSKIFRYFIEYSDKESTKKVRTELERRTSTEEASGLMVCHLSGILPLPAVIISGNCSVGVCTNGYLRNM